MLVEPNCHKCQCRHYQGVRWLGDEESSEVNYCLAFSEGIPDEIAYGTNEHERPCCGQDNDIVYERKP